MDQRGKGCAIMLAFTFVAWFIIVAVVYESCGIVL